MQYTRREAPYPPHRCALMIRRYWEQLAEKGARAVLPIAVPLLPDDVIWVIMGFLEWRPLK